MEKPPDIFVFPTESFYALGADATNPMAIARIFRLKGREKGKPIALIASGLKQVKKFFFMTKAEERLAIKYWPGAVTMLLKPKKLVAARALAPASPDPSFPRQGSGQAGRRGAGSPGRIGVRVPTQARARLLAQQVGAPITATSANISGQPPTKSVNRVKRDFPGIMIVPGRCGWEKEPSTVVEVLAAKIKIIRPGSIKITT